MGLLDRMTSRLDSPAVVDTKSFAQPPFWLSDGLSQNTFWHPNGGAEAVDTSYQSFIDAAFKASVPVFAAIRFRMAVLSEARFQWRQFIGGRPGELFGNPELALLEHPWPSGTTSDLITRMEVTSSLAGNYYGTVADDRGRIGRSAVGPTRRIVHMSPDRVTIVINSVSGDPNALDARVVGYVFTPPPSGTVRNPEPVTLLPEEVCHFAPIPDPAARFRGMSWLTPAIEEVRADKAATLHKSRFFQNGATPNMAITLGADVRPDDFSRYVKRFQEAHRGADKAYKTLFLAGGADIRPLTADFRQMDFKPLQGLAETRVASAAGIHPTVLGFSEGLQGSSLNAGNFNAAARLGANTTLRPWWRSAAASLQTLVTPPSSNTTLWYDDRDIPFLREDATDQAEIMQSQAAVLRSLIDTGWEPDAAVDFLRSGGDLARLTGHHTGLYSVQLQPPNTIAPPAVGATPPPGP